MSHDDPYLTDAEIAAFVRRLVRQVVREDREPKRVRGAAAVPALLPKDVAKRWGCSDRTVRNMIKDGRLPGLRIGGKLLRVRLDDVEQYERHKEARSK